MYQTEIIQQKFDNAAAGSKVVDLENKLWVVHRITTGPIHNNLKVINGSLYSPSDKNTTDKRYGIIEIAKGITLRGVVYPNNPVNLIFENVNFIGPATNWTDDFRLNQQRCRDNGAYTSGVNAMNGSRPDSITVRNCKFYNLFAGVNAVGTFNTKVYDSEFHKIAGHAITTSVPSDNNRVMTLDIYRCTAYDCGTLFDISAPNTTSGIVPPVIPYAKVRVSKSYNTLGRNKVHGQWNVDISKCQFIQNREIPNQFCGLSFPQAQNVNISDCLIENFVAGGIQCTDWITKPTIKMYNNTINGGQMAINSSGAVNIENLIINKCYLNWGIIPVTQIGVQILNPISADDMARRFVFLRSMIRDWNLINGTTYGLDNFWWISNTVRPIITSMENIQV